MQVTIDEAMKKMSPSCRTALQILLAELIAAQDKTKPLPDDVEPVGAITVGSSKTLAFMAQKLYGRLARRPSMRGVIDAMLDKGHLSYDELCKAAGKKNGGPALAGVLSSMTRNWHRYGGTGALIMRDDSILGEPVYMLCDPGLSAPLLEARNKANVK